MKNCLYIAVLSIFLSGCGIKHSQLTDKNETKSSKQEVFYAVDGLISEKEKEYGIPTGLLRSIAFIESHATPYAVNAKRKAHYFTSKQKAVDFVSTSVAKGHHNLSIGCFQLHYGSHRKRFNSIDDMLTPTSNIEYAAKLLKRLYDQYGSWEMAVKKYHAGKAKHNEVYYKKVMNRYNSVKK